MAPELEELEELDELDELVELEELDELLEDEVEPFDDDELLLELEELLAAGVPPQPTSAVANIAAQMRSINFGICILWTPNYCFKPKRLFAHPLSFGLFIF